MQKELRKIIDAYKRKVDEALGQGKDPSTIPYLNVFYIEGLEFVNGLTAPFKKKEDEKGEDKVSPRAYQANLFVLDGLERFKEGNPNFSITKLYEFVKRIVNAPINGSAIITGTLGLEHILRDAEIQSDARRQLLRLLEASIRVELRPFSENTQSEKRRIFEKILEQNGVAYEPAAMEKAYQDCAQEFDGFFMSATNYRALTSMVYEIKLLTSRGGISFSDAIAHSLKSRKDQNAPTRT